MEKQLGAPIPFLYDEGEVGYWPDRNYEEEHDIYASSHPRPWRLYLLRYPWKGQLKPGDHAFITKDGHVSGLSLCDVKSHEAPPAIFRLSLLTRLLLAGNEISVIPPEIGHLTGLTVIAFGAKVKSLPVAIGDLDNLAFLELTDSKIRELPRSMLELGALDRVVIDTRFPESDPVLTVLQERGVTVEVIIGHSYDPSREEITKFIMNFMTTHPGCRWHDLNDALLPHGSLLAGEVIRELEAEGKISFGGETG